MWLNDFDLDEPVTCEVVAETVGARRSLVVRLARQGLIETVESAADEPLLPRRAVVQLRRMQRLRRDLRVNFAGASIIEGGLVRRFLDPTAQVSRLAISKQIPPENRIHGFRFPLEFWRSIYGYQSSDRKSAGGFTRRTK